MRIILILLTLLVFENCCTIGLKPKRVSIMPSFSGMTLNKNVKTYVERATKLNLGCCPSKLDKKRAYVMKSLVKERAIELNEVVNGTNLAIDRTDSIISNTVKTAGERKKAMDEKLFHEKEAKIAYANFENVCRATEKTIRKLQTCSKGTGEQISAEENNGSFFKSIVGNIFQGRGDAELTKKLIMISNMK